MGVEDAAGDRKPEPGPRLSAVAGPHPVEHVEDPLAVRLRDAGSLVLDRDGDGLSRPLGGDRDLRAGGRILGGVVEDVDEQSARGESGRP